MTTSADRLAEACPASYPDSPEPHHWTSDTADGIVRCVKCSQRQRILEGKTDTLATLDWDDDMMEAFAHGYFDASLGSAPRIAIQEPFPAFYTPGLKAGLGAVRALIEKRRAK